MKLRTLIALAILASLISFAKFSHCEGSNWAAPDQYIHACYSDLPSLFAARGLQINQWPYSSAENSVEYPVLTGLVMYATSFFANSPVSYFNVNIFFLALLLIATAIISHKIRPEFAYLIPIAPAMIASLYINWDLWAIATMMLAIYWFDRRKYLFSALALGISISTKFLPIFLLIPILFILWRSGRLRQLIKYIFTVTLTWVVINAPFALTTPTGWWRFYKLNLERGPDWGSIWLALQQLGLDLTNLNYLSILLLLIALSAIAVLLFEIKNIPTLASVSFFVLASVMLASKVYSPQYVLWLTPLAAIALSNKKDLHAFWLWQATEVMYHFAIWQHIALITGAKFGVDATTYAVLTLVRIAGTMYLMGILARRALQARENQSRELDFRFNTSTLYP